MTQEFTMQQQIRKDNGFWLNSDIFLEEAIYFKKHGYYCNAPYGTPDWLLYWEEQLHRCHKGYEVEGQKITGHHYFYSNFTEIEIVLQVENSAASKKIHQQPDFWDGDYDYFWCLEIAKNGLYSIDSQVPTTEDERALYYHYDGELFKMRKELGDKAANSVEYIKIKESRDKVSIQILKRLGLKVRIHLDHLNGGYHMIVGKSRRKGYSYKDGAICANVYNTERNAQIIIGASEKKFLYPKGTMGMASDYLNFLNEHTGWAKSRDYVDKQDHKRASYKTTVGGTIIEKGYKSEIFALSFKDNPDAARGKDAKIILLEEAGAFPNLKDSFAAITPALTAGKYITGQVIIFGTGGDMESGTVDFADMFYNPEVYKLLPFINIWDENAENTTCGFFHPVTWNMEGYYDSQGNSDIEAASQFEYERRQNILEKSSSSATLQKHIQEFPFCPSEAFLTVSTNNFPVVELRNQLNKVLHEKLQTKKGTCVYLERKEGKVVARPDLKNELEPIINYKPKVTDLTGCPIIYEYPVNNPPRGLYKVGYDPYRQDLSSGVSLASIYVYKSVHTGTYSKNIIVAEYVGRPPEADDVNRIASMLADLYNAEIMHENEVTHVKNYFRRIKRLDQLAIQPDAVISKNVKNSTVARIYGIHMVDVLKDAGEKYIKDWLLEVRDYDENGNPILNLETIYSIGLLEELIQYNRKGNFDRVMSFMMCMFQTQEDDIGKDYANAQNGKAKEVMEFMNKMFKRN
jgi:hypothetical protein